MVIFSLPTWTPPLALISSAAMMAPFQCPLPWTKFIGPMTPILIVRPQAGKQNARTIHKVSSPLQPKVSIFIAPLLSLPLLWENAVKDVHWKRSV